MCQKVDDKKGRFFGGGLRRFDKANPIGLTAWMGFAVDPSPRFAPVWADY